MAEFVVNTHRHDPYKHFKFRVKWSGAHIPGVFRVSGLNRTTTVVEHRSGGEPNLVRKSPGLTNYAPITLDRARTHDTAFEEWADKVWRLGAGPPDEVSLKSYRRDIVIEVMNEAGQLALAWVVHRCWPSHYEAFVDLDANSDAILVERLVLAHEGWQRDLAVGEPAEV
jgi:phage tail-like protein